jgi:5-methyltetrahydropteroyltriglutamate--homocysteine methyltransferase
MSGRAIRTTHVGSLVRPDALIGFLRLQDEGRAYDAGAFEQCLRSSVAEVVRRQLAIGLDLINDGEFGKTISWSRYMLERLSGFEQRNAHAGDHGMPDASIGKDHQDFPEFYREYDASQGFTRMRGWAVTGPIRYRGMEALRRDIEDLKRAAGAAHTARIFMTAVAPGSVAPDRIDEHYRSDEEYLYAVAEAVREEYRAILDAGLLLQVDDAYFALSYERLVPPGTLADYRAWARLRVGALNHALRGLPAERIRYHVCWGSWNGPHVSDVPARDIVDLVLKVAAGGYSLEMANPRHEHEWRIWERVKLPPDKVLLPGVISHSTNVVEHPELVAERIVRLARLVGRERVIASTDCGFAQGPFVRRVHPSIMWAKLEALVEGARLATRELWKKKRTGRTVRARARSRPQVSGRRKGAAI